MRGEVGAGAGNERHPHVPNTPGRGPQLSKMTGASLGQTAAVQKQSALLMDEVQAMAARLMSQQQQALSTDGPEGSAAAETAPRRAKPAESMAEKSMLEVVVFWGVWRVSVSVDVSVSVSVNVSACV